jgi:phosphoribosylformylglycinamidine synthase
MKALQAYAGEGGMVLGICNGFQILTEAHLLPGALKRNDNLHFISRHQHLKVVSTDNAFLSRCRPGEILNIPIAHADGNYFIGEEELDDMEKNGQILLRYCDEGGNPTVVNGSVRQIAGICNREKNVFGLMPHPERAMEKLLGSEDGVRMLEGFSHP